jgi:antitoxin component HigA of HigAB toxin-antitoxin module
MIILEGGQAGKQGVGTAIDEYLNENPEFKHFKLMKGEPICLIKKDNSILNLGLTQ